MNHALHVPLARSITPTLSVVRIQIKKHISKTNQAYPTSLPYFHSQTLRILLLKTLPNHPGSLTNRYDYEHEDQHYECTTANNTRAVEEI